MRPGDPAVAVEGLHRAFGDFVAVDRISLTVRQGEVFGFIGPNGAGKSTTIKLLCGLLRPSGGKGTVGGFDILTGSEEIKKQIGYMSQRFSLYDDLSVEQNISFFSGIYGVTGTRREERREWVLSMAGLQDRRKAATRTLPPGFKQRLALGCAILHEPPILFLDEPTSGVDPVSRRNFWDLIAEMSGAGITVFVTTHYLDEAEYCGRLALIYRGRIIAEGMPHELKERYMRREIVEIETDQGVEAMDILGREGLEAAIFGSTLHITVGNANEAIPLAAAVLARHGIGVTGMSRIAPSLEDVFVSLIEEA